MNEGWNSIPLHLRLRIDFEFVLRRETVKDITLGVTKLKFRLIFGLWVFAFISFWLQTAALANESESFEIHDYYPSVSFPLDPAARGAEGSIALLQDKRIKKRKDPHSRNKGEDDVSGEPGMDYTKAPWLAIISKSGQILSEPRSSIRHREYEKGKSDRYRSNYLLRPLQTTISGWGIHQGDF